MLKTVIDNDTGEMLVAQQDAVDNKKTRGDDKTCKTCGILKPITDFYTGSRECKDCRNERLRAEYRQQKGGQVRRTPKIIQSEAEFWDCVDKSGDCWTFPDAESDERHRVAWWGGRTRASKLAYLLTYGDLRPRENIFSICDNSACVRPKHLYIHRDCDIKNPRGIGHEVLLKYFNDNIEKLDDCWYWKILDLHTGYGKACVNYQVMRAHRLSYELHVGPIPDGILVCHRCDNPPCVRPDHLFLGTPRDNTQDSISKGRHTSVIMPDILAPYHKNGEDSNNARFTNDQIRQLRQLAASGVKQRVLGKMYGIEQSYVSRIVMRKAWQID